MKIFQSLFSCKVYDKTHLLPFRMILTIVLLTLASLVLLPLAPLVFIAALYFFKRSYRVSVEKTKNGRAKDNTIMDKTIKGAKHFFEEKFFLNKFKQHYSERKAHNEISAYDIERSEHIGPFLIQPGSTPEWVDFSFKIESKEGRLIYIRAIDYDFNINNIKIGSNCDFFLGSYNHEQEIQIWATIRDYIQTEWIDTAKPLFTLTGGQQIAITEVKLKQVELEEEVELKNVNTFKMSVKLSEIRSDDQSD